MFKNRKNQVGQGLVEFIVAVGIMVIIGSTGSAVLLSSLSNVSLMREGVQAFAYAAEGIEAVKSIRNTEWASLEEGTYGVVTSPSGWEFSDNPNVLEDSLFLRSISVETPALSGFNSADIKKVTCSVSWGTNPRSVDLIAYFTDWQVSKTPTEGTSVSTCADYCSNNGYQYGTCRQNANRCTQNNEVPLSGGDVYCTGGAQEDTCCCN